MTNKKPRQEGDGIRFSIETLSNERRRFLDLKTKHEDANADLEVPIPWYPWEHEGDFNTPLGDLRLLKSYTLAKKYAKMVEKFPDDCPSKLDIKADKAAHKTWAYDIFGAPEHRPWYKQLIVKKGTFATPPPIGEARNPEGTDYSLKPQPPSKGHKKKNQSEKPGTVASDPSTVEAEDQEMEAPEPPLERYFKVIPSVRREELHGTLTYLKSLFFGEYGAETTSFDFEGIKYKSQVERLIGILAFKKEQVDEILDDN